VLATGNSGFGLAGFPAEKLGMRAFSPDFAQLSGQEQTVVMYEPAVKVAAAHNAQVLAEIFDPYFNRTYQHFCSHAHAPLEKSSGDPAALLTSSIGYLAHPIFQTYAIHSMTWHRDLITRMINSLLPDPMVKLHGPRSIQAHVQTRGDETLVHLLHYIPERRGLRYDIVEDALSLAGATLRVRGAFSSGTFQPQGIPAQITNEDGYSVIPLPAISGHTILELK